MNIFWNIHADKYQMFFSILSVCLFCNRLTKNTQELFICIRRLDRPVQLVKIHTEVKYWRAAHIVIGMKAVSAAFAASSPTVIYRSSPSRLAMVSIFCVVFVLQSAFQMDFHTSKLKTLFHFKNAISAHVYTRWKNDEFRLSQRQKHIRACNEIAWKSTECAQRGAMTWLKSWKRTHTS